jgi:hypothetical protein
VAAAATEVYMVGPYSTIPIAQKVSSTVPITQTVIIDGAEVYGG